MIEYPPVTFRRGLLTLSADPFTWGHFDILEKAGKRCQELIVAVLENPDKPQTVFSLEDRVEHVQRILKDFYTEAAKVTVISVKGLVLPTDLYLEHGCDVLFRGVRDAADMAYESTQRRIHLQICPGAVIEFLNGDQAFQEVQSTTVRSLVANNIPVAPESVPMYIQARMIRKVLKQKRLGICSHHTAPIVEVVHRALHEHNFGVLEVNLGALYDEVPGADVPVTIPNSTELHPLFRSHLSKLLRDRLRGVLGGVMLIYSPELVTNGWLPWVCNNVIVDTTDGIEDLGAAMYAARQNKFGQVLGYKQGDDLEALGKAVVELVQERGAI